MSESYELLDSLPQVGCVEWIGISPGRREPILIHDQVSVNVGTGIEGDHHAISGKSKRQVTLIQAEHLPAIAALSGHDRVGPEQLRRNILVSGINLLALKDRKFRIGNAILEGTGPCVPCSLMEQNLGPGGYNAMRGHGGITAVVVQPGNIARGDAVSLITEPAVSTSSSNLSKQ